MPTTFEGADVAECFGTNCGHPPAYRLITLTADGVVLKEQVGGTAVSLLCRECLLREHSLEDLGKPIEYGEDRALGPPEVAILVLPLHLTRRHVAQLREEITEDIPIPKPI